MKAAKALGVGKIFWEEKGMVTTKLPLLVISAFFSCYLTKSFRVGISFWVLFGFGDLHLPISPPLQKKPDTPRDSPLVDYCDRPLGCLYFSITIP
jgi:hypothetical protein